MAGELSLAPGRSVPQAGVLEADMPAIYRAGGSVSAGAQKDHYSAHGWLLILLMLGAVASALSPAAELIAPGSASTVLLIQRGLAILAAATFAAGLWLTGLARSEKWGAAWYDGRALAESAKSMAWKYMMRAPPYDVLAGADDLFCNDLSKLLVDTRLRGIPGVQPNDPGQITNRMRQVRGLPVADRLQIYLAARIDDQQAWYTRRSEDHGASSRRWFRVTIGLSGTALLLAIVGVVWLPANGVLGVVTTAGSCAVAWTQIHRYTELAHSYGFTSQEIGLLHPKSITATDEVLLARFVADCETAFSREHAMWRARREIADG